MHSNHASVLASIACICAIAVDAPAQQAPINGMRPSEPARYALVGAKVIIAPGNTIDKATILIRNGVVESIGLDTVVPAGYRSFDFTGKTIFPAFIEPALLLDSSAQSAAAIASPGAHWNQYITPEVSAIALAIPDATLESLRAQGFAVARVMPANGSDRAASTSARCSRRQHPARPLFPPSVPKAEANAPAAFHRVSWVPTRSCARHLWMRSGVMTHTPSRVPPLHWTT
jgi:hypothetical protein